MGAAAVPIALALSAGSTAYQISESEQAKKEGKRARRSATQAQEKQEAELRQRESREAEKRNQAQRIAQNRLRMSGQGTRRPTILTSPLGLPGTQSGGQKTLLGQ